jgi:hypothetical protein
VRADASSGFHPRTTATYRSDIDGLRAIFSDGTIGNHRQMTQRVFASRRGEDISDSETAPEITLAEKVDPFGSVGDRICFVTWDFKNPH